MTWPFNKLAFLGKSHDIIMAIAIIGILGVMIIPISPFFLDLCLALTLALSIIVLLMAVQAKRPLDFSTFPTVLLMLTLFRLSLNVASTRNILLRTQSEGQAAAGEIIHAFGSFVVGGNFAVGIIIFIILVIINFIVITKGAGRVAEVGARFTLDAMPGKQMAIDADLNAGLINETQAKERRTTVAQEADFYGAMDGASKFVRGDAIAGIIITIVNLVGGIIIGMVQYKLDFKAAGELFTLLTIGDGLVAQIPALVISTAAGIIITRSNDEKSLAGQMTDQFRVHPKALVTAGSILILFSLIPGLPKIPFWIIGGSLIWGAKKLRVSNNEKQMQETKQLDDDKKKVSEGLESLLPLELIQLEVGYGLVNLVDVEQNGDLLERITHLRKQFALDWGVIVPSIRIKDNLELRPGGYCIKVKGIDIAKGELLPDHFLGMDPGSVIEKIHGVETTEPVFGLPAVWITEEQKDEAQFNGYTVVDLSTIIATHLTEILKTNLHELLGRQELVRILDNIKEQYPKLISDLIPDILPLGIVLKVLQNLLRENVSIRDMRTILEKLAESGQFNKNADNLTEFVRVALARSITESVKSSAGDIPLFTLDRKIEETMASSIIQTDGGTHVSLPPTTIQSILAGLNTKIEEVSSQGEKMVVLCSPTIRQYFKKITEKFIPNLIVISHDELTNQANIRTLGVVRI